MDAYPVKFETYLNRLTEEREFLSQPYNSLMTNK